MRQDRERLDFAKAEILDLPLPISLNPKKAMKKFVEKNVAECLILGVTIGLMGVAFIYGLVC